MDPVQSAEDIGPRRSTSGERLLHAAKATCRAVWIAAFRAAAVLEVPSEAKMGMSP